MIQALAQWLARVGIAVVGLPAMSLEVRRAEAAKGARANVALAIGYHNESADGGEDDGTSVEARALGFGEYLVPTCECEQGGGKW